MAVRAVALLHAQVDTALCDTIAAQLTMLGVNVWHDRDQPDSALGLPPEMESELGRARAYVVVLTPATASSRLAQLEINACYRYWQADPSRVIVQLLVRPSQPPALLQGFPLVNGALDPLEESARQVVAYVQAGSATSVERPANMPARPSDSVSRTETPATPKGGAFTRRALLGAGIALPVLGGLGYLAYSRHILMTPRRSVSNLPGAASAPQDHSPIHYLGMSQYFATSLAWSPDGHAVAVANAGVHVFNSYDATPIYQYHHNYGDEVYAVAWSPDGKRIACTLSYDHDEVHIWDAFTGANEVVCRGPRQDMYSLAWSPDGTHVAVGSNDGNIYVFGASSGKPAYTYQVGAPVVAVSWSPDGTELCSNGPRGSVRIWNPSYGEDSTAFAMPNPGAVNYLAWFPNSKRILAAQGGSDVVVSNLSSGQTTTVFADSSHPNAQVSLSANGRLFASATGDSGLRLLDMTAMQPLAHPVGYSGDSVGVSALACSPNGQRVALCEESTPSGNSQVTLYWLS